MPAPRRAAVPCPHFPSCPGCPLVGRAYADQLATKTEIVHTALAGALGEDAVRVVAPIVAAPAREGYRVQSKLMVRDTSRGPIVGLYRPGTHRIEDASGCPLHDALIHAAIPLIRDALRDERIAIHGAGRAGVRYLLLRASVATQRLLVTLVSSRVELDAVARLTRRLRRTLPLAGLHVNENTTTGNVILGERMHRVWGETDLLERYGEVAIAAPATAFVQANTVMAARIYAEIARQAALTGTERVVDLYCGVGGIALTLAAGAREVVGIEESGDAVAAARRNARRNRRPNVRFEVGRVESALAAAVRDGVDLVTVNPPRKGCGDAVVRALAVAAPPRILYLSCSPASLARDAAGLVAAGYRLERVQPLDLLPQTEHVEVLAGFTAPPRTQG